MTGIHEKNVFQGKENEKNQIFAGLFENFAGHFENFRWTFSNFRWTFSNFRWTIVRRKAIF